MTVINHEHSKRRFVQSDRQCVAQLLQRLCDFAPVGKICHRAVVLELEIPPPPPLLLFLASPSSSPPSIPSKLRRAGGGVRVVCLGVEEKKFIACGNSFERPFWPFHSHSLGPHAQGSAWEAEVQLTARKRI